MSELLINFNGRWLAKPMTEYEIRAEIEAGRPLQYASKNPFDIDARLRYVVIDRSTGLDAKVIGCPYVVTPEGLVAWRDDSAGWEIDKDQARYEIRIIQE